MSISASANIGDIQLFIKNQLLANEKVRDFLSSNGFDELFKSVKREISNLGVSKEENNNVLDIAHSKRDECVQKIDETEQEIDETEQEIEETESNIEALEDEISRLSGIEPPPVRLAIAIGELAEEEERLVSLQAHLAELINELNRLRGILDDIDNHISSIENRNSSIDDSISSFNDVLNALEQIQNGLIQLLSLLSNKFERSVDILTKAVELLASYLGKSITEYDPGYTYEFQNGFNRYDVQKQAGLVSEEYNFLKEKTGYSNKILDFVRTTEEGLLYKNMGLVESVINNRYCLTDPNLDLDTIFMLHGEKITNRDLMRRGRAPIGPDGKPYNVHHIGQDPASPFAELINRTHKKYNSLIHTSSAVKSRIDRNKFRIREMMPHWRTRAEL